MDEYAVLDYDDDLDRPGFVELAIDAMLELVSQEHAVVWHEIEAKLAEQAHRNSPRGYNPHVLTNARNHLIATGQIEAVTGRARGGREITVYGLANRRQLRRETKFDVVAARKRLLETRYLGWAEGSARARVIGDAGELVTHRSLHAAAASGYRIVNPTHRLGNVEILFNRPVPGGSLDNAAHLIVDTPHGESVVTVVIEVKNLRAWLYPRAEEIYQLLDKAAQLQIALSLIHI